MLHELIGLAQAKPGSKFVEVFRHAGGGRGRVPISLQVGRLAACGEGRSGSFGLDNFEYAIVQKKNEEKL